MIQDATARAEVPALALADTAPPVAAKRKGVARHIGRYGLSAFGPLSIAAAHFIASLIFLRVLAPAGFGLVSFAFVAVPPFLSITMALLTASLLIAMYRERDVAEAELTTHFRAGLCLALCISGALGLLMLACGAGPLASVLFGAYAGLMSLRQFQRSLAYIQGRQVTVAASDGTYSAIVFLGLGIMFASGEFSVPLIAALLMMAAAAALLPFGHASLKRQFTAGLTGWLKPYRATFRDLSRWSLLGVVSTELTVNAHAYLVTLIAGPHAFAILAAGALFLRPVSLFLTALPELERPAMAKGVVAGDVKAALRPVRNFRIATGSVWIVTVALAATILFWFPSLVLKGNYAASDVATVCALWAAVMAVRIVRTPDSCLLQAAAEFKPLAWASVTSALASLVLTLAALLIWGPVASLLGILAGEIAMMVRIRILVESWKRRHG